MTTKHEALDVRLGADPAGSPPPATKRLRATMAIGNLGLWVAFFSPVIIAFPVRVAQLAPENKELALSYVLGIAAVVGLLSNPIVGRLSDRSLSRFGRRRPYLLGVVFIGVVGIVGMGVASNLAVFAIGAVFSAIAFAGGTSVLLSIIPDHIPPSQRGSTAGLLGVSQAVGATGGIILGGILIQHVLFAFLVPAAVGLVAILVLCVTLRETPITADQRPAFTMRQFWGSFWTNPRKAPAFGWAWLSRFAIFMAFASVINYQVYYLTTNLHLSTAVAAKLVSAGSALESLVLIIAAIVFGRLSDRTGRRRPFVIVASVIGAIGLVVLALTAGVPGFFLSLAIIGLAQGVYYSVDLALVADILPNKQDDAGKDFGIFSIASTLPQTLGPVIAPLFLGIGAVGAATHNYAALFIASAAFAVIAGLAALRIRGIR